MSEERWEIDVTRLTLDDLVLLEEADQGLHGKARALKDLFARLLVNMDADTVGSLTIEDLANLADRIGAEVQQMALPKTTNTD